MCLFQDPDVNRWWRDPTLREIATGEDAETQLFFQFYTGNNDWGPGNNDLGPTQNNIVPIVQSAWLKVERILNFVRRRQKIEKRRQKDPTYCFKHWTKQFQ